MSFKIWCEISAGSDFHVQSRAFRVGPGLTTRGALSSVSSEHCFALLLLLLRLRGSMTSGCPSDLPRIAMQGDQTPESLARHVESGSYRIPPPAAAGRRGLREKGRSRPPRKNSKTKPCAFRRQEVNGDGGAQEPAHGHVAVAEGLSQATLPMDNTQFLNFHKPIYVDHCPGQKPLSPASSGRQGDVWLSFQRLGFWIADGLRFGVGGGRQRPQVVARAGAVPGQPRNEYNTRQQPSTTCCKPRLGLVGAPLKRRCARNFLALRIQRTLSRSSACSDFRKHSPRPWASGPSGLASRRGFFSLHHSIIQACTGYRHLPF